jgi:hypothetical protein
MSVQLHLSEDRRYLIYTITEPFNLDELLLAYTQERSLRDSIPYTLHSITDMSGVKRIPPNWLTAKAGPGLTHPRSGEILIVGVSFGLKIILDTILKITRSQRMKFFRTRAEADAYMADLVKRTPTSASV